MLTERSRHARRWAFTLIELLVVVAIIALLVGIIAPSLARARQAAQRVVCLSNLHSIGVASLSYQNNYRFPPYFDDAITLRGANWAYSWSDFLIKGRYLVTEVEPDRMPSPGDTGRFPGAYLAGMVSQRAAVLQCPMQKERVWADVAGIPVSYRADYVATGHVHSLPVAGIYRSPRYYQSPNLIWLGEAFTTHGGMDSAEYVRETQLHIDPNDINPLRHFSGGNYLFGDGHAEWSRTYHQADWKNLSLPWEPRS